ncbi:hypothetical protein EDB83DRAFT_554229 [Lactarius deliciosus]|nr:hypothetical protein EDB83DRAFT_554229 [Lactarius deliciosus]
MLMFTTISLEDTKTITPLPLPLQVLLLAFLLSGGMSTVIFEKSPVVLTRNRCRPLQQEFLKGIEQLLVITYDASRHKTHEDWLRIEFKLLKRTLWVRPRGESAVLDTGACFRNWFREDGSRFLSFGLHLIRISCLIRNLSSTTHRKGHAKILSDTDDLMSPP